MRNKDMWYRLSQNQNPENLHRENIVQRSSPAALTGQEGAYVSVQDYQNIATKWGPNSPPLQFQEYGTGKNVVLIHGANSNGKLMLFVGPNSNDPGDIITPDGFIDPENFKQWAAVNGIDQNAKVASCYESLDSGNLNKITTSPGQISVNYPSSLTEYQNVNPDDKNKVWISFSA
jgi:hypothetical protein